MRFREDAVSTTARCNVSLPPWEERSKHFTQEFEAIAITLMREVPVKHAGQIPAASVTII